MKPEGCHFEALGIVWDGTTSSNGKTIYEKGHHVTGACVMAGNTSRSAFFREFISRTKRALLRSTASPLRHQTAVTLFKKRTFVMDRGYGDNKIFPNLLDEHQDFVIRIRKNRKLYYQNRWLPASESCARCKGKIKMCIRCIGTDHEAWLFHVKVRLTAFKLSSQKGAVTGCRLHCEI